MSAAISQDIAKGIARAFFVSHWADQFIARSQKSGDKIDNGTKRNSPLFMQPRDNIEYWEKAAFKMAPPASYYQQAWRLIGRIEDRNETDIGLILRVAMKADGHHFFPPTGYAVEFGRFLGYHSTGHASISWFDNHAMFGLIVPPFELVVDC
jgi:hypothetical protein